MFGAGRKPSEQLLARPQTDQTGIQSLRLEQTDDGIVLCFEDNCNRGRLPVGDGASPNGGFSVPCGKIIGVDGCKVAFRWKTLHADPYGKWRILSGIYHEKENDGIVVQIYSGPWDRRVGKPEGKEYHCSLLQ